MQDNLQAIDAGLMWEYGPGIRGGHRLVITPESDRHLRPMVETILERAPKLEGWEFYAYRLPESITEATAMLKARALAPIAKTKVLVSAGEHHLVDLTFSSPEYSGPEDQGALNSVFVASEVILGEQMLDTWIGVIAVERQGQTEKDLGALENLKEAVEREVAAVKARLPTKPAWQLPEETQGTLWKLKPEKRDDYPGQTDLFVGRSTYPDMWEAAHAGSHFSSERFSRAGELFCYVKLDGSVDLADEKFRDKSEIEDALDAALKSSKSGAVIGGGTGLRYSYVDLALTDVDQGIEKTVNVLREGKITKRAWILFFDDVYRQEWVGIWDESPPPPGME